MAAEYIVFEKWRKVYSSSKLCPTIVSPNLLTFTISFVQLMLTYNNSYSFIYSLSCTKACLATISIDLPLSVSSYISNSSLVFYALGCRYDNYCSLDTVLDPFKKLLVGNDLAISLLC